MASSSKTQVIITVSASRRTVRLSGPVSANTPQSVDSIRTVITPNSLLGLVMPAALCRKTPSCNQSHVVQIHPSDNFSSFFFSVASQPSPAAHASQSEPAMPSTAFLRLAARGSATFVRAAAVARPVVATPLMARSAAVASFSTSVPRRSEHAEETFEEFTAR